ncbi:MAG: iron export ABC transporter permease subunit FetB [Candidatus Marinimicrobia bacterium]|jgi:putative ABC transport system permease protein|nr:iron export ABC transporter permease subunit FetB [Candidatus Neomarinimicrobiota bacterium]MBT5467134.1 iron export ABC transporter permease subunit FetB [Candidatus Neomarinimicrobiota bacterium]MBT7829878.1 iron export ABC transporter permease subunit FetB [Candidatus Neomarinimicrobiota bacterium]
MRPDFYVLSWSDLLVSLFFIAFSLFLIKKWKLGLENTLLIGSLRTFVQLTLMGYVLTWFFDQQHWAFMLMLLLIMILIASYEGTRRQKNSIPHFFPAMLVALLSSAIIILGTILLFILDVKPWYSPYAAIPIGGMIIGNGLNSTALTANRFVGELKHREKEIETLLALGATPKLAVFDAMKASIHAALIPNINAMMTVGLVQLPGVMTGQILAGIDPIIAVRYQIMIMYMWFTTATMANMIMLAIVYRQYFTSKMQLRRELLREKA